MKSALAPVGGFSECESGDSDRISASTMITAHLLASHLSNTNDMLKVSKLGVELLFPGLFASSLETCAAGAANVPKRLAMRSHKVCFDIAYTLFKAREFK